MAKAAQRANGSQSGDSIGWAPCLAHGDSRRPTRGPYLANIPRVEIDDLIGITDFLWDGSAEPPESAGRPDWWLRMEREFLSYNMGLSFYG